MVNFEEYVKDNVCSFTDGDQAYTNEQGNPVKAESPLQETRSLHPQPWCGQHLANGDNPNKNIYIYSNQEDKEKTPMCRVAELARFHKIKHEYKLLDESGPAHKKLFTVQLVLTNDQVFDGSGASIKKAQQAAAAEALDRSTLRMPPEKNGRKKKTDPTSPIHLLSQMARRLNIMEPSYRSHALPKMPRTRLQGPFMPPGPMPPPPPHLGPPNLFGPPCPPTFGMPPLVRHAMQPLQSMGPPHGIFPCTPPHSHHPPMSRPGPVPPLPSLVGTGGVRPSMDPPQCVVSVTLGQGKVFTGHGPNFIQAKTQAAIQALSFLGPAIQHLDAKLKAEQQQKLKASAALEASEATELPMSLATKCVLGNDYNVPFMDKASPPVDSESDDVPKHRQKSVISQVHECALQMKLNVSFEVLMEDGPPHERTYVVKCSLLNLNNESVIEETGEGRKKKEATQNACCVVLNRLQGIENSPIFIASHLVKAQKKSLAAHQKEPKRKTIVKDMKMDPAYGHQINPVSRLIQVLQARGEPDPQFTLIGEHGQSRYKEFMVEVACSGRVQSGSGPNKRLAKRAAAEAMLAEIGFVKPLPAPGKSLLKRKEPQMTIGVFDPNDLGPPPAPPVNPPSPTQQTSFAGGDYSNNTTWGDLSVDASSPVLSSPGSDHHSPTNASSAVYSSSDGAVPPSPSARRRVTFNSQVESCPPPEDANYPQPEVAPLKADVIVEGKLKRIRKTKEGKRALSDIQKAELSESAMAFVHAFCTAQAGNTFENVATDQADSSRRKLAEFSDQYKFTVQYSALMSPDSSDKSDFVLVSVGLDVPLVTSGHGSSPDAAADNGAYNAICKLSKLADPIVPQAQLSPISGSGSINA